jgi:hypothetical protein
MHLQQISDDVLGEAVRSQPSDEFDSHDVIFWISRNRPRDYAADLHVALEDDGDPFLNLHSAIGRRLAALPRLVQQQHRKQVSMNVRGDQTECEVWRRSLQMAPGAGLAPGLLAVHQRLTEIARQGNVTTYRPVADLLGIPDGVRLDHCRELIQALDDISVHEHSQGRPLLSVVVVGQETNRPGNGFFTMAQHNGVLPADQDEDEFFRDELRRAHEYWGHRP